MPQTARVIHDSRVIVEATPELCALFRCGLEELIDRELTELLADPELKQLCHIRMESLRTHRRIPGVDYSFIRFDGSEFVGHVETRLVEGQTDRYESVITRLYDVP